MGNRIYFLDNLRTCMILLAVLCAAASGFMIFPPDQAYIIEGSVLDGQRSLGFDMFYSWADAFILPVLFFICGYFGASSLRIRQLKPFFKQKWHRIGTVWLFGAMILAPQLAYLAAGNLNDTDNFFSFYIVHFWTDHFEQGQFWFLGILFGLYMLLLLAKKFRPHCLQHAASTKPSLLLMAAVVLLDGCAMTGAYVFYGSRWIHPLYIFMFQPIHIAGIVLYFFLGIYACKHRWFINDGYVPSCWWLLLFGAASLTYIGYRIPSVLLWATPFYIWFLPAIRAVLALSALMGLLYLFAHRIHFHNQFVLTMTAISYPLYVVSETLLQNTAWFLQPLQVSPVLKFTLICTLTFLYAYMLGTYVLLRIPPFKK